MVLCVTFVLASFPNSLIVNAQIEICSEISSDYPYTNTYFDCTGVESGEIYYIMNANTGRLLCSDSSNSCDYTTVSTQLLWELRSQWEIVNIRNNEFNIFGFGGTSGVILKTFGTSVEIETQENISSEEFTIRRIQDGIYAGLYYIMLGTYYVCQDSNNDVYLSDVMTATSRWSFMNVTKRTASMYAFNYTVIENGVSDSFKTIEHISTFRNTLGDLGYALNTQINVSAPTAYDGMRANDDVFVFYGHGNPGLIAYYSYNGSDIGVIATSPLGHSGNSLNRYMSYNSQNQLAKLRCVLYLGCKTGVDDSDGLNLVDETFNGGAHFVLGMTRIMYTSTIDSWLELFFEELDKGSSIKTAINYANFEIDEIMVGYYKDSDNGEPTGIEYLLSMPLYYKGDAEQRLNMN